MMKASLFSLFLVLASFTLPASSQYSCSVQEFKNSNTNYQVSLQQKQCVTLRLRPSNGNVKTIDFSDIYAKKAVGYLPQYRYQYVYYSRNGYRDDFTLSFRRPPNYVDVQIFTYRGGQVNINFSFTTDGSGSNPGSDTTSTTTTASSVTTGSSNSTRNCGKADVSPSFSRIVGGTEAVPHSWPWQALLYMTTSEGSFLCGGSLIDEQWIMTAAHCVEGVSTNNLQVYLGVHNQNDLGSSLSAQEIKVHENYSSNTIENDIALIKLSQSVQYTDEVRPVCLPTADYDTTGQQAVATGWGLTTANINSASTSNVLQQVQIPIRNDGNCGQVSNIFKPATQICAGSPSNNLNSIKDSCSGDSGGPLSVNVGNSRYEQIGIVSYGTNDVCDGYGVYTEVYKYLSWINDKLSQ